MLKYGDLSLINNGNSKSLVPRNLTYRQKESFKSDFGESDILNIINSNTIENIYSNHIYTTDITAIYANLNVINSTILYVDLISKKTSLDNPIIINNKLQITNQDGSFNYLLSSNGKFEAISLNIDIPEIEIVNYISLNNDNIKIYQPLDLSPNGIIKFGSNLQINNGSSNVVTISSTSIDTLANITLLNTTPNIKFTTGNELIIKDISNYIGFLNNNIKFYQPLDLSPNGIIKFGSNLYINNGSFNVITISSTTIDTLANITLLNTTPNIKFTTGNELIIKDTSNYIGFLNNTIKVYQPLDLSANGIIKFGSNLQINNGFFNVVTINSTTIDTLANITLLNTTPNINFTTGNELIIKDISNYIGFLNNTIKVYQPLDLSANGIIKFGSNLQINNGSSNVITISSTSIDTLANITLLNTTPNINFTTGNELIIKDTSNYIGFLNNTIKVYQPLDLSANGIIKFGSNLQINNGSSNVITINSNTIDTLANITLLNTTPNINFTTGNELIIKDISNYIGFLNNTIKVYQPLDLSPNGIIKFGSSNVITINSTTIDISANITLLNTIPNINFTTGNELIIKDASNYLGFLNNTIKVYQPLDLSPNGIIKFGSNLQINNGSSNVITINSTTVDISANITLLNTTPNINFTTGNELIIKDTSNYIGFLNNTIKIYQPLDLSPNGIIKFGSFNVITINSNTVDISANITLLNTTPNIKFTTGNELIIKDTSNYVGFLNNNIKIYQPLDLSANGIIKFGSNLQINNGSSNVVTINSTTIDTSANITLLNTTPNIKFTTGNELIIKDISNYIGFLNNTIKIYQPLDLSPNGIIKFGSSNVITINSNTVEISANITLLNTTPNIKFTTGNELIIKDASNYLGFLNNNIKVYQPLDLSANGIIKFGSNLHINNGSSNVITINSTTVDISANITLLNATPNIKFTTGNELIIKDISNYLGFLNNNIKVYQPLDLSANGIIKFGSNLHINNGSFNVVTINSNTIDTSANITFLNNIPEIKFNDSLKLYNSTYSDNSSNAILVYNTSSNDHEKKYLKKVIINNTEISKNVYFCNIINSPTNILTFTGKIVSVADMNSSHIIFQGYSRILNGINTVTFTTNILFSSDPINWTIKTMILENTNLVMEISDNINTILSNWIISLESISI